MYGSLSLAEEVKKPRRSKFTPIASALACLAVGLCALRASSSGPGGSAGLNVALAPADGAAGSATDLSALQASPVPRQLEETTDGVCSPNSWQEVGGPGGKTIYQLTDACAAFFKCEAGNYCPAGDFQGTEAAALAYFESVWWPSDGSYDVKCEVVPGLTSGDWAYQCKCGNGFYCPDNTAMPKFCPKEFYCKTPATADKCPADRYCKAGTVTGRKCNVFQDCPKGSSAPETSASGLVWFVAITIVAYIVFTVWHKFKEEKASRGNQELEDYREVVESRHATREQEKSEHAAVPVASVRSKDADGGFLIEFDDIHLVLPDGTTIMRGPSGKFRPGTSTAIMGASGAGKTTIMNLVTGKVKKTSGTIKCNGEACESLAKWKNRIAFVPQEDVMHRHLTVLENIEFSALTRLPANWTAAEKREKVMDVLYVLNLTKIQHSKIGDEFERGVSGGQRKRVNVGLELVSDPKVLFLDEPTSGLDSVSATELAKMLREIAERDNLTIAAVIHSPGPACFDAFSDYLLLQTGGRLVYAGKTRGVADYFAEIGFKYPEGETLDPIADYVMKCVAGGEQPEGGTLKLKGEWDHMTGFTKLWNMKQGLPPPPEEAAYEEPSATAQTIALFKGVFVDLAKYPGQCLRACFPAKIRDKERPTVGFFQTFKICFGRACRQQYVGFGRFFLSIIVLYFAVGQFLTALMPDQLNVLGGYPADICQQQYPQLTGACLDLQENSYVAAISFMAFIIIAMAAATAAATFGCETAQYWREASAGLSTPAYFFAKVLADMPLCLVSAFAIWGAFVSGFNSPMDSGELLLGFALINIFGYLSGYFLSFLLPYTACGLAGVAWAVWWGLMYSGTGGQTISDNVSNKWLYDISAPRWFMEGVFYSTTVYPFEKVRDGPNKGQDYYDMSRVKSNFRFYNNFMDSMGYMMAVNVVLLFIDLWLITTTKLAKKM